MCDREQLVGMKWLISCASVMEAVQTMLRDQELFLVFRIFPNLKRISSCSLYFALSIFLF